jgi:MFS family permease
MNPQSALARGVVLLLGLVVLLNYVDRGSLATAAPLLQDEFALSSAQIGLLLSAFFWTYAPAQLLAGWLVHRYDIRLVLAAGVGLWALATAMTGLAGGFASILVCRLMLGLGESVSFPSCQLLVARHALEHERGRVTGFIGAGQGIGPMLGTFFGGLALARFGWHAMFFALGAITLLWIWPWLIVTRRARPHALAAESLPSVSYVEILGRREFWGAALGHFAINYTFYFVITWLPTFLVKAGGYTIQEMAVIGGAIYGIYGVSTAIAGTLADRWIKSGGSVTRVRKFIALTGALGAALTIACSAYVEPRAAVWLLGVAGGFFGLTTSTMFAIGATLAGSRAAGRWAAAQNVAGQVAGIIAPVVTGVLIDRTGSFSSAFVIAALFAVLAMVAWGLVIRRVETVQWPGESVGLSAAAAALR